MDSQKQETEDPAGVYSHELDRLASLQAKEQRRVRSLGLAKLIVALLAIALGLLLLHHPVALSLVLVLLAAFVVLAIVQDKLLRSTRYRARAIDFYERGLARLNDTWAGTGESGNRFADPLHPYARDLDLFGEASLFELLCTARTRAGEETLANWLLKPASIEESVARQSAIQELSVRVKFRERLWSLGQTVRLGVSPAALSAWGEAKPLLGPGSTRLLVTALAALWFLSLICWGVWGWRLFALLMTVGNLAYSHRLHSRLDESSDGVEAATKDLALLAGVLSLLEEETFTAPRLQEAQASLTSYGVPPSKAIRELARIVDYLESRRNPFVQFLNLFTFWNAQLIFACERWQARFGPSIRSWLAAVGELEALAALAGFAYEHPRDTFPDFVSNGRSFLAEGLAHPLLPAGDTVRNDLQLGDGIDLIILSGPNMAGKSTFMRSIGINIVLAQCGAPVRASRMVLSPFAVAASICVLDSLKGGISRFYAEINRVKLILDLTQGSLPVLFLLDELLSGTNSHDRLIGTQYVVESLVERNAVGIVSTHDLALARIPEALGARAVNAHFEDRLEEGKLVFDYKLKPGVVQTSNALELMRSIGLGVRS